MPGQSPMSDSYSARVGGQAGGLRPSNAALVNGYVAYMRARNQSPNTIYSYQRGYAAFLTFLGKKSLLDVTFDDIDKYLNRSRARLRDTEAAPSTVKGELMELRSLYKWLHEQRELIGSNPARKYAAPKVDNEDPHPVPIDIWQLVWSAPLKDDERVALGLGYFCGLRRQEVTRLTPSQFVDEPRPVIASLKRKGGKKYKGYPWTSCLRLYEQRLPHLCGDMRTQFVNPLRRLIAERSEARLLLPWADEINPRYVTRTTHRIPEGTMNPAQFNKHLERLLVRLGLPGTAFTPHSLRHSFCTNLLKAGVPILTVSRLAGHSSVQITERYIEQVEDPLGDLLNTQEDDDGLDFVNRWG